MENEILENKVPKKIEVVKMKVSDLNTNFGNPRKIRSAKREDLRTSLKNFGDFGLVLIDENNSIIAGNQRVSLLMEESPDTEVLCKRLVGYTEAELRSINIKDNTHNGEWDLDLLADWTSDLTIDLGLNEDEIDPVERKIKDMELIHYEKYDYVIIVCKNEVDYLDLQRKLGIDNKKVLIPSGKRKIKARAIWFDKIKAQIISKDEAEENEEGDK